MHPKIKRLILTITLLLVFFITVQGYFGLFESDPNPNFSTTPKPLSAYNEAQEKGEAVFLEFYADW